MNKIIEKINFKKVVIIYIIIFILSLLGISSFLIYKFYNKIEFIYNYHVINELYEKKYDLNDIKNKLNNLVNKSQDVVDAVIISNNNITFSVNNIYKNNLTKIDNSKKYFEDEDNNIYKLCKEEKLYKSLFIQENNNEIEYDDEFNIDKTYNNKYIISYIKNKNTNEKIILITQINKIQNAELYIKLSLSLAILLVMIYWIITVFIIYQNAYKSKLNYNIWSIITLFTNVLGVIIYIIYKYNRITCNKCNTSNTSDSLYCRNCGAKINKSCKKCHNIILPNDKYCKSCGEKI